MANNFQNVTLSLTLPISCQICLGKVRHPVICANNHVFCSCCMDIWLKKASQCPSCRVPITSENPCREIIGGTNESESNESYSVKKHLRKTRGELLLREYEDEMEGLLKENEELRNKNRSLESQLKTVLDPCTIAASRREDRDLEPGVAEEGSNKLRAATDGYSRIKLDVEKLKEANKTLRCQTIDLVQENVRLKAEVSSRSPQKFGRYTVAALEAKIHQYERDVDHLKKALERSDQYIEELEARGGAEGLPRNPREAPQGHTDARPESTSSGEGEAGTRVHYQRIGGMTRSLSDMEKASICASLEGESKTLSAHHNYLLATSNAMELNAAGSETFRDHRRGFGVTLAGHKDSIETDSIDSVVPSDLLLFSTPSSAFRSLSLKSPSVGEDKKLGYKAVTHLRRLSFEDSITSSSSSSASTVATKRSSLTTRLSNSVSSSNVAKSGLSVATEPFWAAAWQSHKASDITSVTSVTSPNHNGEEEQQLDTSSGSGHSERNQTAGGATTSHNLTEDETDPMSSEASMDAAYLDKISELDSMMLEGPESCSSAGSHLSSGSHLSLASSLTSADTPDLTLDLRLDVTLVPEAEGCSELFLDSEQERRGQTEAEGFDLACRIKGTSSTPVTVSETQAASLAPVSTTTGTGSGSSSGRDAGSGDHSLLESTGPAREQGHLSDPSQTDELSFDLLFDPLTEAQTGAGRASAWQASANHHHHEDHDISSGCCSADRPGGDAVREKSTVTPSQATKRKSHSPFNVGSPSKHSKFM
ncbi:ORC ubiquitin ligase 1-like [Salvelinus namaycush]|uniref:ORC ubiquitin ligase 1-like n=1 Tax=Salvelinus namaycush TaxID=8040 RepID=A0A8U0U5L3_SALNM|nr:ORC ubiquitin ligase 1-like [Salvelinus namaycush]XP_038840558.1 ORC ubiquitin ligase 1-like [Salvelinus namaycush]